MMPTSSSQQTEEGPFRVLHVDDDPDFAELTTEMLEANDERFSVESVTSASDGFARFTEDDATFDCIVSDHDMPGRNGIEFLEAVRERDADIPLILFTGKGSQEVASEAISVGVTDYLQKGDGTDQYGILANRIRNNIERTRAERAREELRERMELALKHTDSVIFELDLDTGVVRGQGQFEQFAHDLPDGDLSWRDYCEYVVHPDDHAAFQDFYEMVMCGEVIRGAIEYRTKPENGDVRWIRGNVAVDQQSNRALGLAQDITEDKTQERDRERIIARVTDAIVKVDAKWRFTLVNDRAEECYEMREAELLGRDFWDVFSEAVGTRFEDEYRDAMETREMTAFVEYYSGLDGWCDVRVYPNDDGGLSFYFREIGTHLAHT